MNDFSPSPFAMKRDVLGSLRSQALDESALGPPKGTSCGARPNGGRP